MPSRPHTYLLNNFDLRMRIIEQGLEPQAEHRKTVYVRSERAPVRDSQIDNEQAGSRWGARGSGMGKQAMRRAEEEGSEEERRGGRKSQG